MHKQIKRSLLIGTTLALFACSDSTPALQNNVEAEVSSGTELSSSSSIDNGEDTLTQAERIVKHMGRGMNFGNALEGEGGEGSWGVTLEESYFQMLADSGFTNIRIPTRWDVHMTRTEGLCVVDSVWMARVKWAVSETIKNGMIAVLDQHHYAGMYDSYATETECFLDIWKAVANEMKSFSTDSLVLEILNEPQRTLAGAAWNVILNRAIDTIRVIDPKRTLMVGGDSWNSIDGLSMLELPAEDRNIIATFHYYEPYTFTHQGATWGDNPPPVGPTWRAEPSQKSAVRNAFAKAVAWSELNDRPLYLGEFGAFSMADDTSRAIWTEFVASEASRLGIASAYWEFCSGFGVYDAASKTWKQHLMNSLLHPSRGFENEIKRPKLDTTSFMLLDDFDAFDGELANINAISQLLTLKEKLPLDSAKGRWYAYHNSESRIFQGNGDTLITGDLIRYDITLPKGTKQQQEKLIVEEGHDGRGLYAKMHLKGDSYPYVGVGVNFVKDSTEFDFKNLVGLSFWAKGVGDFKVAWVSSFADTCCSPNWGKFSKEITLTPEWKQYVIWVDEWVPSPYSALEEGGYLWADHHLAAQLQFMNGQGYGMVVDQELEISIDDVRFYGMTKADFGL